jgi:F-type H+-transporting ATPase subunit epsilon
MSAFIELNVITPEKKLLSQDAGFLIAPGYEGCFGVLPGHAPLVTLLKAGQLSVGWGERPDRYAVSSGYAEVLPDRVTILVERAVAKGDIDVVAVKSELEEAEMELATLSAGNPEWSFWSKRRDYAMACLEVSRIVD